MRKEITTSIQIQAKPEVVWSILMDFEKYPEWNPFISSLVGKPVEGERLKANIQNMKFNPKVLVLKENTEFKWVGNFLMKGVFDGEHRFLLSENEDGTTTLIQSEKFNGILVRFMQKMLDTKTVEGFKAMNVKLKERAENSEKNSF